MHLIFHRINAEFHRFSLSGRSSCVIKLRLTDSNESAGATDQKIAVTIAERATVNRSSNITEGTNTYLLLIVKLKITPIYLLVVFSKRPVSTSVDL